jgi:hypothetical protein
MFIGFIYVVTNTVNGKVYVGKTTKPFDGRWKEHQRITRSKSKRHYLHNAIRKHGEGLGSAAHCACSQGCLARLLFGMAGLPFVSPLRKRALKCAESLAVVDT